jgi:hypothetical protein
MRYKNTWLLDSVETLLEPAVLKKSLIIFCLTDMAVAIFLELDSTQYALKSQKANV